MMMFDAYQRAYAYSGLEGWYANGEKNNIEDKIIFSKFLCPSLGLAAGYLDYLKPLIGSRHQIKLAQILSF